MTSPSSALIASARSFAPPIAPMLTNVVIRFVEMLGENATPGATPFDGAPNTRNKQMTKTRMLLNILIRSAI
jgi:hypothetical protein